MNLSPDIKYAWYKCPGSLLLVIRAVPHWHSKPSKGRMYVNNMLTQIGD